MHDRPNGLGNLNGVVVRISMGVAIAFAILLNAATAAQAQPVCMPHDDLRVELNRNFAESPVAIAVANNGALIELYAKRDGSSWTLVMTRPAGVSCVLVAGEGWNDLRKRAEERIAQLDSPADLRGR